MKKLIIDNDSVANKISYWHLAFFLIVLPFDFFYSQVILISFTVHTFINVKKSRLSLLLTKQALLLTGIYFVGLITILYSSDKQEGFNVSGRQTGILLLPVLFILNELDLNKYRKALLKIFAFAIVVTILYLYFDAVRTIFYFHLPLSKLFSNLFINHNFSAPIEIHATYLSMYTAIAICIMIFYLMQLKRPVEKLLYWAAIIILSAGLIQLSSRAVVVALVIIINLFFPFFILKGKMRWIFIIVTAAISIIVFFIITTNSSFKLRYIGELKNDLTQASVNNELLEPRIVRWQLALPIVRQSLLIGHGNGSEKELLRQTFYEHKLYISYLNAFNAHSEYLSFLIKAGIVGLLIYLYTLFSGFSIAFKKGDFIFVSFMIIIAVVSISENILDVNKGIFFYGFFMAFFTLANYDQIYYRQPVKGLQRFDI